MIRDYRYGWHEARTTFGNGKSGQNLADIERHLSDQSGRFGLCGEFADQYARFSWLAVATRIEKAKICGQCEALGHAEEATLKT